MAIRVVVRLVPEDPTMATDISDLEAADGVLFPEQRDAILSFIMPLIRDHPALVPTPHGVFFVRADRAVPCPDCGGRGLVPPWNLMVPDVVVT